MNPITGPFDPIENAIFIDFDGVLHDVDDGDLALSTGEMLIVGEKLFQWAPILAAALDGTEGVAIVVHSSWRHFHSDEELRAKLPGSLARLFAGSTHDRMSRSESIESWAIDHGVKRHIILDDMAKEFPKGLAELILCHPKMGISDPAVMDQVRRFLAGIKPSLKR